jgi:hypothetical protein
MMYEYVVGVKTSPESVPHVYSTQTLTLKEVKEIVRDCNREEKRRAEEENREVSQWFVGLFRATPAWMEIRDDR